MKSHINALGKLLQKFPNDPIIRGNYISTKKNFRKLIKKSRAQQRELILEKIKLAEEKNPTTFWNLVNNIKDKKDHIEHIEPSVFLEYFKSLHSPDTKKQF